MKTRTMVLALLASVYALNASAQARPAPGRPDTTGGHRPPPRAYQDCRGRKAGDTVRHLTPQGLVPATCVDSPEGLVARPVAGAGLVPTPTRAQPRSPTATFTRPPAAPPPATATRAPAFTQTKTRTPSWTPTRTFTPTPTRTNTPTVTFTPTARPTNTPTFTPTAAGNPGPAACATDSDCAAPGACPADALEGCACALMPQGRVCVPQCTTSADCPKPPDKTLVCSSGVCVQDGAPTPGGGSPTPGSGVTMNTVNTISDQAQSTTIAFDGLAFVTGRFCAQTFYPPGKVADFFGFQFLRDNDPSNLGHNTEFTTLSADPVLAVLNDAQITTFVALAKAEQQLADDYGYARFPLAQAFRRLIDGDTPSGHPELSRDAVKAYSADLFAIDGEMSYRRAQAYASVLTSLSASQKAVLDGMKGHGAADWSQPATEPAALRTYGAYSVELRTYAGEMFAWYAGNTDADVYFCPERQGTYFGSFFMKDIKAMHNPSYTIDSNMTADMGNAFLGTLDATQRAQITGLVDEQRTDLLAIVAKREQIATALRQFLSPGGSVDEAAVLALARQYGELDGEISYFYATHFAAVGRSLTAGQQAALISLRKTATAEADGSADYDLSCGNGYLYSAPLAAPPTVMDTDFMFGVCSGAAASCSSDWGCCSFSCTDTGCGAPFSFSSAAVVDGWTLPTVYTCDAIGGGVSPPLQWTAPANTVEYALTMTTVALDGTKYNWVLFHIPATVTSLAQGSVDVGTTGVSTDGPLLKYYPPCSTGPGDKTYTFTLYALSGTPTFTVPESQVTGPILTAVISPLTLAARQITASYTRSGL